MVLSELRLITLSDFCIWVFPKIYNGTPKWMVYFMENPIKMDGLGGFPIFLETPI